MHTAPTVAYPVERSRFQTRLFVSLWFVAFVVLAGWMVVSDAVTWRHGVATFGCMVIFAAAWRVHRKAPVGQVGWDGGAWWWESDNQRTEGLVKPCLDFQHVVLVYFQAVSGPGSWLWLERRAAPLRWSGMRCAVMQRQPGNAVATDADPALHSAHRAEAVHP